MDHHCPWLATCVGYHNLKPFLLYSFYQVIMGELVLVMLIYRWYSAPDELTKDRKDLSDFGAWCYWISIVINGPMCLGLWKLAYTGYYIVLYENMSSVESAKTPMVHRYPFVGIGFGMKYA